MIIWWLFDQQTNMNHSILFNPALDNNRDSFGMAKILINQKLVDAAVVFDCAWENKILIKSKQKKQSFMMES